MKIWRSQRRLAKAEASRKSLAAQAPAGAAKIGKAPRRVASGRPACVLLLQGRSLSALADVGCGRSPFCSLTSGTARFVHRVFVTSYGVHQGRALARGGSCGRRLCDRERSTPPGLPRLRSAPALPVPCASTGMLVRCSAARENTCGVWRSRNLFDAALTRFARERNETNCCSFRVVTYFSRFAHLLSIIDYVTPLSSVAPTDGCIVGW